ncbi:MAG: cytochrome c maturation protein CcmE [Actinomycetota bacterium]
MEPSPAVVVSRPPRKRLRYIVAGGLCAAAVVFLLVGGLSRNIVYFRTVSEAVREQRDSPGEGGRIRMAGNVVIGSVVQGNGGVSFKVTEGGETVSVVHRGDPGDLFKDGAPVVCEGRFAKSSTGDNLMFESDRLMIKHGAEYRPPAVEADREPNREQ